MPSAPHHLSISAARSGALFASPLQRSDEPSARQVQQAIATAIGVHGVRGCAARVAQAYGEHPETALTRMGWALTRRPAPSPVHRESRPPPPHPATPPCPAQRTHVMLKSTSSYLILLGVLAIIVGIIALAWPGVTVLALVILFAVHAFIGAGLQLAHPFSSPRRRGGLRVPAARAGRPRGRDDSPGLARRCRRVQPSRQGADR